MKRIWDFVTELDKQALRAFAVVFTMFAIVVFILVIGRHILNLPESDLNGVFQRAKLSGFALPIVILIFSIAAFLGIPQWVLIAGVVAAFGPLNGGVYAWLATLCSASIDFWLGRRIGAERLHRFAGDLVNRIISIVQKNGFTTSFAIRFVPTGPFVLVNMAAGVARIKFISFLCGTGLGIIPKIAIVALVAQGVLSSADSWKITAIFLGLAGLFILAMFLARKSLNVNYKHKS